MQWDSIGNWVLLTGAVGTASMGLVEAGKAFSVRFGDVAIGLGVAGLGAVKRSLGKDARAAVESVYGEGAYGRFLEGAWRKGPDELETVLRNGLRMALFSGGTTATAFVKDYGGDETKLAADVVLLRSGTAGADTAAARERVARLEAAIDARVQAAVASGRDQYAAACQVAAMVVAVVGCLIVSGSTSIPAEHRPPVPVALLIGFFAVPVAPVAKDVVTFLNSVRDAFGRRHTPVS